MRWAALLFNNPSKDSPVPVINWFRGVFSYAWTSMLSFMVNRMSSLEKTVTWSTIPYQRRAS